MRYFTGSSWPLRSGNTDKVRCTFLHGIHVHEISFRHRFEVNDRVIIDFWLEIVINFNQLGIPSTRYISP